MNIRRSFYRWVTRTGLRGLASKSGATGRSGLLNASWDAVLGAIKLRNAEDLWGTLTDAQRQDAYKSHAMIYSCIRKITTSFLAASPELGYYDGNDQWQSVKSHEVLDLLKKPNPKLSLSEIFEYDLAHLLTTGKSYLWKWRDNRGRVAELWPIPSHWVKPVPLATLSEGDSRRFIAEFKVRIPGGKEVTVPVGDMIYRRFIDPSNFIDGIGPLQACYRDYKLDTEKDNYIVEMLENLKVPGIVLKQSEEFDEDQKRELRAALNESIGKGKRGSPLFLHGEEAGIEFIAPLKDLDWPGLSGLNESHICAAFGVPPLLVHARIAQENSPLSAPNLEAAEKIFYRGTMTSLWIYSETSLTQGLIVDEGYGDVLEVWHNTDEVKALKDDLSIESQIVERLVNASVMSIDVAQERMGLPIDEKLRGYYLVPAGKVYFNPAKDSAPGVPIQPSADDQVDGLNELPDDAEEEDDASFLDEADDQSSTEE